MAYFLGIDVSTTSSKALVIDETGRVIATAKAPHTLQMPKPLWSEQDPREWWIAVRASIRAVLDQSNLRGDAISAVGLTGQMHGLVLLDDAGEVLRPAILWNDQRTQAQCDEIMQRVGEDNFIRITGNRALTGFTAPKILWVAQNEPEVYSKARHILLPKDYVRLQLTGEYAMDKADGSGTVLFQLERRDWSPEILSKLEIPAEWLPPTYEGTEITGRVSEAAAALTGLAAGTPVVAGGGDQSAQAVGVGVVRGGMAALTLGTSGVVFAATQNPLIDQLGRLHSFCHAVPGLYHFMGVMLSAAGSLQWYRDTLTPEVSFSELTREAESVPAGSEGLFFLPYLSGERTPHADPLARGAFIGLTTRHTRAHLTRAVLEGVAYGLKDILGLMTESRSNQISGLRVSGGGAKSSLWLSIIASVLDQPLSTVNTTEGAAFGAALLAAVGSGVWRDVLTACEQAIEVTGTTHPIIPDVETYQKGYGVYKALYPALKSSFAQM